MRFPTNIFSQENQLNSWKQFFHLTTSFDLSYESVILGFQSGLDEIELIRLPVVLF